MVMGSSTSLLLIDIWGGGGGGGGGGVLISSQPCMSYIQSKPDEVQMDMFKCWISPSICHILAKSFFSFVKLNKNKKTMDKFKSEKFKCWIASSQKSSIW